MSDKEATTVLNYEHIKYNSLHTMSVNFIAMAFISFKNLFYCLFKKNSLNGSYYQK